ncbi:MAG: hypothetical protein ACRDPQ_03515 [Nocardioidaceae bacterium]
MSRRKSWRPGPWLYLTIRSDGGAVLVRGDDADRACTNVGADPKWSRSGRGWVIGYQHVADLFALAEVEHRFIVVSDKRPADEGQVAS